MLLCTEFHKKKKKNTASTLSTDKMAITGTLDSAGIKIVVL
jgi:hypothetical protein